MSDDDMSDDDLIRRGDVRREFADYCPAAGDDFNRTLDRVPAVPPAAERLTFDALRRANLARLPEFRDRKGRVCHVQIDGQPVGFDWSLSQWSNAVCGELGEAANLIKKIERGDMTLDEARSDLADEICDVVTYLDILAHRAGIDMGEATIAKWNRVSERVGSSVRLAAPPAAEPAPRASWVCAICDGGPANDCACSCPDGGKREPAIFQKPPGSLDEGAVRGNNPEPAPCGTCGGSGNVGSPCPDGARFIDGVRVSCAVMHSRPCPSCRPGGAA